MGDFDYQIGERVAVFGEYCGHFATPVWAEAVFMYIDDEIATFNIHGKKMGYFRESGRSWMQDARLVPRHLNSRALQHLGEFNGTYEEFVKMLEEQQKLVALLGHFSEQTGDYFGDR